MRSKLSALGFVLILGALILSGCAPSTVQPTESPKVAEGEYCLDKDTGAKLSYQEAVEIAQSSECLEQGQLKDTHVCNESTGTWWIDLDIDKPGCMPACVIHVADRTAEINWRCTGAILPEATVEQPAAVPTATPTEAVEEAPDPARARDAALAYLSEHYGEQAPPSGLTWTEECTTPEGLVGSSTFEYTAENWVVTVSFPIVAPENVVYQIVVANQTTGFQWEGEVDAAGQVTETAAPKAAAEAEGDFQPLSPAACSDLAKAMAKTLGVEVARAEAPFQDYIGGKSGTGCQATATGSGLDFENFPSVAQDLKGMLEAQGWQEEISYAADGPTGTASGFRKGDGLCLLNVGWKPSEDAECPTDQPISACELSPDQKLYSIVLNCAQEPSPTGGQPAVAWYGYVVSAPEDAPFDDYLVLEPEGTGKVGLSGADATIEAEIEALRDKEEPGKHAHFWGTLTCDGPDHGGCQLVVSRLRPDGPGPFFPPDPVEGWEGTIYSGLPGPRSGYEKAQL